jgi:hypothetical protein
MTPRLPDQRSTVAIASARRVPRGCRISEAAGAALSYKAAERGVDAMKFAFGVIVFIWVLCGLIGAWWLDDLDADHWKVIAKGPISLAKAYNENQAPAGSQLTN